MNDLLKFLSCSGLEIGCNYSCVILESVCLIRALWLYHCSTNKISMSDNFIYRVVVHYYAKGDKCDVTGVQVRMKWVIFYALLVLHNNWIAHASVIWHLLCCDSSFDWLLHFCNCYILQVCGRCVPQHVTSGAFNVQVSAHCKSRHPTDCV